MDALLVGLGNPGPEYALHRHNVGFMALERIGSRHSFGAARSRFRGLTAEGRIGTSKVLGLKPTTFMNRSGDAVAEALQFYKLSPERVIVLYDEIDLAPGKLKVKKGGGAAGHNGIRSIDAAIGPDFWRVRIGVGHPGVKELVHGYVLHAFAKADRDWLDPMLDAISDELAVMIDGQSELFMTRVAARLSPPRPSGTKQPPKPKEAT
ncbi:MAG: aminoacyl-tRNA hydrolase [Rhodospirillales bacterium]|nr:aminoacyl-tRNA hydrolase [Rhodospirillales bacterium]